jgi:hypothetical protein
MTAYDPDDGEPYGTLCECPLGEDHNVREYREHVQLMTDMEADWGQDDVE